MPPGGYTSSAFAVAQAPSPRGEGLGRRKTGACRGALCAPADPRGRRPLRGDWGRVGASIARPRGVEAFVEVCLPPAGTAIGRFAALCNTPPTRRVEFGRTANGRPYRAYGIQRGVWNSRPRGGGLGSEKGRGHKMLWCDKKYHSFLGKNCKIAPLFPGETCAIIAVTDETGGSLWPRKS